MKALLTLEDGQSFPCKAFAGSGEAGGEIVFNTSMIGYQEIFTDPSYCDQIVIMTYPMIGNYGINFEDVESDAIHFSALFVKEYQTCPNNFKSVATLADYLNYYGILGLEGLDTRALTKHIRESGSMRAFVSTQHLNAHFLTNKARCMPEIEGLDLVSKVSTFNAYRWRDDGGDMSYKNIFLNHHFWKFSRKKITVVVFDCGVKFSILRSLVFFDFEVLVVPANTDAESVIRMAPDGVMLSNGPGDPSAALKLIETTKVLISKGIPLFGVCLGHQILARALGASTYNMKFGHRGSNQPVKNLLNGQVEITSQNHGFAVDRESMVSCNVDETHFNLNDDTVEGMQHRKQPIFSVQYHPESAPGPRDSMYLFDYFKTLIGKT